MAWPKPDGMCRSQLINGRVTETEYKKIQYAAKKLKIPVSQLVQKAVMQLIQEMK